MGLFSKLFGKRGAPTGTPTAKFSQVAEPSASPLIGAARRGDWDETKRLIRGCNDLDVIQEVYKMAEASFASSSSKQRDALRPLRWCKGKPNPTSPKVIRSQERSADPGVLFLCPACLMPSWKPAPRSTGVAGGLVICSRCSNVSHVPAAYMTQADVSGLAIHGGVRVPIAEFGDWMLHHPSYRSGDASLYGSYGLYGLCAGCHYKYESTVLALVPITSYVATKGATVTLNVHSAKSGQDAEALSKRQCPRCGTAELIAIMVDVPKYVRDATNAKEKSRA